MKWYLWIAIIVAIVFGYMHYENQKPSQGGFVFSIGSWVI